MASRSAPGAAKPRQSQRALSGCDSAPAPRPAERPCQDHHADDDGDKAAQRDEAMDHPGGGLGQHIRLGVNAVGGEERDEQGAAPGRPINSAGQ